MEGHALELGVTPVGLDRLGQSGDAVNSDRLLPDVGGTWRLARAPGEPGTFTA